MKFIAASITLAGLWAATGNGVPARAQSVRTATEASAQNLIRGRFLENNITYLCDSICAGRKCGTKGATEAAYHIWTQFESYGLKPFTISGYSSYKGEGAHNILCTIPASTPTDSYIIVGAHYDNLGTISGKIYPGADSNASGVAVMLGLAKMFSYLAAEGRSLSSNLLFVAIDGKESDLEGSKVLWNAILQGRIQDRTTGRIITKSRIKLMVNIDQIGATLSPVNEGRPNYLIMLGNNSLPGDLQGWAAHVNRFSDTRLDLTFSYYGSKKFTQMFYEKLTDQRPFVENKVPAVLFTSGITMKTNKTTDTPDTIDYQILLRRTFFIYHWLYRLL